LILGALLVFVFAVVAAGCGSSSSDSTGGSSSASTETTETTESGSDGVAEAKAFVEEHDTSADLEYPEPPKQPYDQGTGKLGVVVCSTVGTGCLNMGKQTVAAAKAAGWEPTEIGDGEFNPAVQSGIIERYVQEGVDAIVISAIDLPSIEGAIAQAEKAGIPITCISCNAAGRFKPTGPIPLATVRGAKSGEYLGNLVVSKSEPGERIVQFTDKAFTILVERAKGAAKVIEEKCPECDYEEQFVAAEELSKPGPPYFSAALATHPEGELGWAFAPSDDFNIAGVKTIEQQGRAVKVAGGDGEGGFFEEMISSPEIAVGTVLEPFPYEAWAAVDNVMRMKAGMEPWDASDMPPFIVDNKKTAEEAFAAAPDHYAPPGFEFEEMFGEIWSGK
jgi:ABC-type sugar transport system substrate-binding protein